MKEHFKTAAKINRKIAKAYRDGNIAKAADAHEPGFPVRELAAMQNFQIPRFCNSGSRR